jgi:hypothetical protein
MANVMHAKKLHADLHIWVRCRPASSLLEWRRADSQIIN